MYFSFAWYGKVWSITSFASVLLQCMSFVLWNGIHAEEYEQSLKRYILYYSDGLFWILVWIEHAEGHVQAWKHESWNVLG